MVGSRKLLALAGTALLGVTLAASACEARPRQRTRSVAAARRATPVRATTAHAPQLPATGAPSVTTTPSTQGTGAGSAQPARPRVTPDGRPAAGNVVGRSATGG